LFAVLGGKRKMKLTNIRNSILVLALAVAPAAYAATIEQLFIADVTGGLTATIDVDNAGTVTCVGACGGLTLPAGGTITPHTDLRVFGTIGQFFVDITGSGGVSSTNPTLQTLTQANVENLAGAGRLVTEFTDSRYCEDFPSCFGTSFLLGVTNNPDSQIIGSSTTFTAFVDPFDGVPATTPIGAPINLVGLGSQNQTDPNVVGPAGSLSALTDTRFTGMGKVQTTFTISTNAVPEPSTFAFFGIAAIGLVGFKVRSRKA